jgi:outer membrane murein-binding lipoprotein Lpp
MANENERRQRISELITQRGDLVQVSGHLYGLANATGYMLRAAEELYRWIERAKHVNEVSKGVLEFVSMVKSLTDPLALLETLVDKVASKVLSPQVDRVLKTAKDVVQMGHAVLKLVQACTPLGALAAGAEVATHAGGIVQRHAEEAIKRKLDQLKRDMSNLKAEIDRLWNNAKEADRQVKLVVGEVEREASRL